MELTVSRETEKKVTIRRENAEKLKALSVIVFSILKSVKGGISRYLEISEHSTPFYLICYSLWHLVWQVLRPGRFVWQHQANTQIPKKQKFFIFHFQEGKFLFFFLQVS